MILERTLLILNTHQVLLFLLDATAPNPQNRHRHHHHPSVIPPALSYCSSSIHFTTQPPLQEKNSKSRNEQTTCIQHRFGGDKTNILTSHVFSKAQYPGTSAPSEIRKYLPEHDQNNHVLNSGTSKKYKTPYQTRHC